jgi:ribosome-associated protein
MIAKAFHPTTRVRRPDETPLPASQEALALSKTRRKADMEALQDLGEALLDVDAARLSQLDLPERLVEALGEARRITRHEARRRHMQFIGRLMRDVDPAPIRARLAQWADAPHAEKARAHAVERWRERLLSEAAALDRLCAEQPAADRDRIAALIDTARAERARGAPPRAYRELYRCLNRLLTKDAA